MSIDPRWPDIAREWLQDCELPEHVVTRYTSNLAQILHDQAEHFVESDIPEKEREREEAAYDHHINRLIDEARGK